MFVAVIDFDVVMQLYEITIATNTGSDHRTAKHVSWRIGHNAVLAQTTDEHPHLYTFYLFACSEWHRSPSGFVVTIRYHMQQAVLFMVECVTQNMNTFSSQDIVICVRIFRSSSCLSIV